MTVESTPPRRRCALPRINSRRRFEHDYVELSDTQRCDLRLLPCELLRWADALDPERAPAVTADDGVVVRFRKAEPVRAIEQVGR